MSPPPAAESGQVAFDQVFEAAGIAAEERDRVTKTRDLLAALPPGTDAAVKKQIVEASLKAFGVPIDRSSRRVRARSRRSKATSG